jgi:hypothetical protein
MEILFLCDLRCFMPNQPNTAPLLCSGEQPIDVPWITWFYILPPPLSVGVPPSWGIPKYVKPPHCQLIHNGSAGQLNIAFLQYENHPCTFLSQGTVLPDTLDNLLPSQRILGLPQP